jgi:hypothetical protein
MIANGEQYELVEFIVRIGALSYILRAGVRLETTSEFRTIQAKIDTILFRRLQALETQLSAKMQKMIWVSAGKLTSQQQYPV